MGHNGATPLLNDMHAMYIRRRYLFLLYFTRVHCSLVF